MNLPQAIVWAAVAAFVSLGAYTPNATTYDADPAEVQPRPTPPPHPPPNPQPPPPPTNPKPQPDPPPTIQ